MTMKDVPHSAPATARTGFHMLERHMLEKRNDGKRLFHNQSEKKLSTATKKGIPIGTSLAKPKLVRSFNHISILRYHEKIN